jgi:hypothetical protein
LASVHVYSKLFSRGIDMSYTIKHMGLGGILDQAIAIVRNHFILLLTIVLIVLAPVLLIQHFLQLAATPQLPPHPTMDDIIRARQAAAPYTMWMFGFSILYMIVLLPVANAAVIQAVARVYLGLPVTAMEAISHGLKRLPALIGTGILVYLVVFAGFIMLIIPGIYFSIWYGLSQHVVVIEGLAGWSAMKRSKKLVHKDRGTFLALMLITFVIAILIGGGTNFIPQPHLKAVGTTVAQALLTMFGTAALVVFYFSCRCHVENFDLHYLAQSIGTEPADDAQVVPATTM